MGKKDKASLSIRLVADLWSALIGVIPAARWKDLAAVARGTAGCYIISAEEATPDAIIELQKFETLVIIIQGKVTKQILTAAEQKYFADQLRQSNAWLN